MFYICELSISLIVLGMQISPWQKYLLMKFISYCSCSTFKCSIWKPCGYAMFIMWNNFDNIFIVPRKNLTSFLNKESISNVQIPGYFTNSNLASLLFTFLIQYFFRSPICKHWMRLRLLFPEENNLDTVVTVDLYLYSPLQVRPDLCN